MSGFKPISPLSNGGIPAQELDVITSGSGVGKSSFTPVSPKQMVERGATNHQVLQLLSTFDSPTGILEYGKDAINEISKNSTDLLSEVTKEDADMVFIENQLMNVLMLAKKFDPNRNQKKQDGWLSGLISDVKEKFIDTKEQLLAEFNTVSTQMDRVLDEVEQANSRILGKIPSLQKQYHGNIQYYKNLDIIIKNAKEAKSIKIKEYSEKQSTVTDALEAQNLARMSSNIDRLDKKIENLEKIQMMCLLDAPELASKEEDAVTVSEKFETIKTITLPLWARKMRAYIDGQVISNGAKLAGSIDDANNKLIIETSNARKAQAVEIATLNQRSVIDDSTIETVHQNLLDSLDEVLTINANGRQRREQSSTRMDEMKRLYASIGGGQVAPKDVKSVK